MYLLTAIISGLRLFFLELHVLVGFIKIMRWDKQIDFETTVYLIHIIYYALLILIIFGLSSLLRYWTL